MTMNNLRNIIEKEMNKKDLKLRKLAEILSDLDISKYNDQDEYRGIVYHTLELIENEE